MKSKTSPFYVTALAAFLITPAFALEAPADDAPPPPVADQPAGKLPEFKLPQGKPAQPQPQAGKKAESAFLGVISDTVPDMLAEHLALKPDEGIIVRALVPEGPAAKSGITVNDVITKVAGQPVGSPLDISTRISAHKPGDKVTLDLIHKGKPTTLDVTLAVKPEEIAAAGPQQLDPLNLEGFPKELAERVRDAIAKNIGALELQADAIDPKAAQPMEQAMRDMQKRMQDALGGNAIAPPAAGIHGKIQIQSGATIRMNDGQGSIEMKTAEGSKEVTIRDQQGNITWSGPWDTAQDKAAAPAGVQERVASLNIDSNFNGKGLRLQMRQPAPADPGNP